MQMKNVEETEYINNLKKKQILNINNLIKSKSEQDQIQALDLLLDNVYRLENEDFTLKVIHISDTRNFDLKKKINRFLIHYSNESKYLVLTFNTILKDLRDHNIQLVYLAIDFIGSINYIDEYFVKYFVDLARTGDSEMRKILCKNMRKMFLNKIWVEKYDMLPLLNEMTLDFNNIYALELIFEIDHLYKVFDNDYIISMLTKCNHPYEGKLILLMILEKRINSNQKIIKTTCNFNTIVNKNDLDTNKDNYFENNDKKCGINNFDKQFNFTKYENDVDEIYFKLNANEKLIYLKNNKTDCLEVLENLSINKNLTKKDINYEYNCSFENKLIDKIKKICLQYIRCPRLELVYLASKIILNISNNHSQIVYDHLKKFIKHGTVKTYFILEFIREMIKNQKLYDFNYDNSDFLIFKDDPEYIKRIKLDILHLQHDEISKKETLFCVFDQFLIFDCLHLMLKKDYTCKNLLRKCFLTNVSMTIDILYENLPFDQNWFKIIYDFLINCKISRKYHKKIFFILANIYTETKMKFKVDDLTKLKCFLILFYRKKIKYKKLKKKLKDNVLAKKIIFNLSNSNKDSNSIQIKNDQEKDGSANLSNGIYKSKLNNFYKEELNQENMKYKKNYKDIGSNFLQDDLLIDDNLFEIDEIKNLLSDCKSNEKIKLLENFKLKEFCYKKIKKYYNFKPKDKLFDYYHSQNRTDIIKSNSFSNLNSFEDKIDEENSSQASEENQNFYCTDHKNFSFKILIKNLKIFFKLIRIEKPCIFSVLPYFEKFLSNPVTIEICELNEDFTKETIFIKAEKFEKKLELNLKDIVQKNVISLKYFNEKFLTIKHYEIIDAKFFNCEAHKIEDNILSFKIFENECFAMIMNGQVVLKCTNEKILNSLVLCLCNK